MARPQNRLLLLAASLVMLLLCLLAGAAWLANTLGIPPRKLGPYIEFRTSGHNPAIERTGEWISQFLTHLDRPADARFPVENLAVVGPRKESGAPAPAGRTVLVQSFAETITAIEQAQPGDVITFVPGHYEFSGGRGYIPVTRPGTKDRPITVRAPSPNSVTLDFKLAEGFLVTAPFWTFENLTIRGKCKDDSTCEHAFHVVGQASHFVARNNTITDFDAHFKVNGSKGTAPDHGRLENNILSNSRPRLTNKPVTSIDLVAASHWLIKGNVISDFIKLDGDKLSYGAYAKGAGSDNRFIGNMVICEDRLRGQPGGRVGLSLGGGGTGKSYCRDQACIVEQQSSTLEANLIMSCSDEGIHLNKAAASRIIHNTLLDTGPVVVRFPESSATVEGNLVDAAIRTRDGGMMWASDNLDTSTAMLYLGQHPVRDLFTLPERMDLSWRAPPPARRDAASGTQDLCGQARPDLPAWGAFEDFKPCVARPAPAH